MEEYDDLVGSTAKYREEILALSGVDIMLDSENFKSTYQILLEISQVWDNMSDVSQAALLERLAGKRNTSVLMSIINNIEDLTGAYDSAANAAGTASAANDIYLDSITGKLGTLKATAEDLSTTVLDDEAVKGAVDAANALLTVLNGIFKTVGGITPLLAGLGAAGATVGIAKLGAAFKGVNAEATTALGLAKNLWSTVGGRATIIGAGAALLVGVICAIKTQIEEAYNSALEAADTAYQKQEELTEATKDYSAEISDLYKVLNQAASSDAEQYEAKVRLAEIQSELNELFGDAAPKVENYKQDIDALTESLYNLAAAEANAILVAGGQPLVKEANKIANASVSVLGWWTAVDNDGVSQILSDFASNNVGATYRTDITGPDNQAYDGVEMSGNAYTMREALLELYAQLGEQESEWASDVAENVAAEIQMLDEIITESGDSYLQYVSAKVASNEELRDLVYDVENAQQELQSAIVEGEYKSAKRTLEELEQTRDNISAKAAEQDDAAVASYLNQIVSDIDEVIEGYHPEIEVGVAFGGDSLGQSAQAVLDSIALWYDENGEVDIYSILNHEKGGLTELDNAYDLITDAAIKYGYVMDDGSANTEEFLQKLLALGTITSSVAMDISDLTDLVDKYAENVSVVQDALEEMTTAGGLTHSTIDSLTSRYRSLEDFNADALFEYTANGIMLNTNLLQEYEKQLEDLQLETLKKNLSKLIKEYEDGVDGLDDLTEGTEEYADALDNLDGLSDEIAATEELIAQYEGLLSAFTKWQRAKETANSGDIYNQAVEDRKLLAELYEEWNIGTDDFQEGVRFFFGGATEDMNAQELAEVYEKYIGSVYKFFNDDSNKGAKNFVNILSELGFVTTDAETGLLTIAGSIDEISQAVQRYLGFTDGVVLAEDAITALLGLLRDKGWEVEIIDSTAGEQIDATIDKLTELNSLAAEQEAALGSLGQESPPSEQWSAESTGDVTQETDDEVPVGFKFYGLEVFDTFKQNLEAISGDHDVNFNIGLSFKGSGASGGVFTSIKDALLHGITGAAFAGGTRGKALNFSGKALVGELGRELVVRDGEYFTVGNSGAEMFDYKRGDIIFSADQTEDLLSNGKLGGPAYALGTPTTHATAMTDGTDATAYMKTVVSVATQAATETVASTLEAAAAQVGATGTSNSPKASIIALNAKYIDDYTKGSVTGSQGQSSSSSSDPDDFDWIEVVLDRIERTVSNLETIAGNTYKLYSVRSEALHSAMASISEEMQLQQKAYDAYMAQANSVGLSSEWVNKVQSGDFSIDSVSDEDLADKIKEYQSWYEKALDCRDAIDELSESLSSLYEDVFSNIESEFDGVLGRIEHATNLVEAYISKAETAGYNVSAQYYEALIATESKTLASLQEKQAALVESLNTAVDAGAIAVYSEAWYELQGSIDEVTEAIVESQTALVEYQNQIRQLSWDRFDYLEDKISDVVTESEWLIDLLSNSDLFEDGGDITAAGLATMGLHLQNYHTYAEQMADYADAIAAVNKEIANDPANTLLLERKQELVEVYRELVSAAEDEKQALKDLVSDGIDAALEAMEELIDTYVEALDNAKDLYDFQKSVADQVKTIASLEKQLSAYGGDDSEEARATIQSLKVELEEAKEGLEETQYDQYISDTKALLDDLASEYETVLNQRLDNIDALLADCTSAVSDGADLIASTIQEVVGGSGYTLSDSIQAIWTGEQGISVVAQVTDALAAIKDSVDRLYSETESGASADVKASASTATTATGGKNTTTTPATTTTTQTTTTTSSVGDFFITKKSNASKSKLNINSSVVDRLKYNDFDSSYSARSKYYTAMGFSGKYTGSAAQNAKMIAWMKSNGYKSGARRLFDDQLAWTQEGGAEAIIRGSDGAILTSLHRGDTILDAAATENIWSMANDPSQFIAAHSSFVPMCGVDGGNNISNTIDLQIVLPNVTNYEEFMNQAKSDPKFERLIQAMTTDRLVGGSSKAKNRLTW